MDTVKRRLKRLATVLGGLFVLAFGAALFFPEALKALAEEIITSCTFFYQAPNIYIRDGGYDEFMAGQQYTALMNAMGLSASEEKAYTVQVGESILNAMPPVPDGFTGVEWDGSGVIIKSADTVFNGITTTDTVPVTSIKMASCYLTPDYCDIIISTDGGTIDDAAWSQEESYGWIEYRNPETGQFLINIRRWNVDTCSTQYQLPPLLSAAALKKENQVLYQWSDNRGNIWEPGTSPVISTAGAGDILLSPGWAMKEGSRIDAGEATLLENTGYVLADGSFKLQGDSANTYAGGITFYVPSTGDYIFTK